MRESYVFSVEIIPLRDSDGWRVTVSTKGFTIGNAIAHSRWRARAWADDFMLNYFECYTPQEATEVKEIEVNER